MSDSDWVRALGIDYGSARIGLAVSDDLGMLAHPLETVDGSNPEAAIRRIVDVVSERRIRDIILGLPLLADGREGEAVERVRHFSKQLRTALPETVPIHEVDESFSTHEAMAKLHTVGRNEKNSRAIIDQAAAVEILQRWLDSRVQPGSVEGD